MTITHGYIIGQTRSGKSHLAKALTAAISKTGKSVIVHDPTAAQGGRNVNGWTGAIVCPDFDSFEAAFWQSRNCLVVIDEAPEVFAEQRNRARRMILRGRHLGHVVLMIAQRHTLMDKSARNQANHLWAFVVDPYDSEELAREWNCDALRQCHTLRPRQFIELPRHGDPKICQI